MQRKVSLRIEGVEKKAFNYHKKIYEAIASKDPEGAWLAMDNHLIDIMKEFQKGKSIYNELKLRCHCRFRIKKQR